ncbi:MAG: hypothetical protein BWY90_01081 [Deltaproteobacteria bacterium ADurb.BinA014]|nr:MAG: hypothetical protein BWY90_01081 [Deltaproteobacteria bacterium ADurb.BinA014]HPH12132.1 MerR family transcriptional regulator [Thermotogota bacterium]
MENLKRLTELSKESGVPESTIRRWIEAFRYYFAAKKIGRITYYSPACVSLITRIKSLYEAGKSTAEIEEILSVATPKTLTIEVNNSPRSDAALEAVNAVMFAAEKIVDQRKEIQLLSIQILRQNEDFKELRERIAAVESKDKEIESLKTEIAILKKTLDFTNANAELLHERVEKIENPPKETTWRAFLRLWKRK